MLQCTIDGVGEAVTTLALNGARLIAAVALVPDDRVVVGEAYRRRAREVVAQLRDYAVSEKRLTFRAQPCGRGVLDIVTADETFIQAERQAWELISGVEGEIDKGKIDPVGTHFIVESDRVGQRKEASPPLETIDSPDIYPRTKFFFLIALAEEEIIRILLGQ